MKWINFLHFYQPATVSDETIDEVVKSSYQSWADFLNQHPELKITVNFTGCLTERLHNQGYQKLLDQFSKLAKKGQIEFMESAAFHPILPLLPEKEIVKQIQVNSAINKKRFGDIYQPQGFFIPEMAYSDKVARIIKQLGYKYIILDEISLHKKLNKPIDNTLKYKIKNIPSDSAGRGLEVVFRNRKISQSFVPKKLNYLIKHKKLKQDDIIITASDGELYGHHYWHWWPAYTQALKHFSTQTLSEYLNSLKQEKEVKLFDSSWESTEKELKKKIPYAVWSHPKNKIHKKLWCLANFALKLNWENQDDENHFASRLHLEKGLASCTFWWASGRDFMLVSPHAWHSSMVEIGAHELLNSIRSLENISKKNKLKAEKLFSKVRNLIWQKHWKK